jgi:DNA-binding NtrC family response regulator
LVVDDDSGVLRLVVATLQSADCKILEAICDEKDRNAFLSTMPNMGLVLSDVITAMPGSGMIWHILRIDPCVRMMFMTGTTGEPKLPPEYFKKKFILLHKPITIEGLIESVEKSLATCAT